MQCCNLVHLPWRWRPTRRAERGTSHFDFVAREWLGSLILAKTRKEDGKGPNLQLRHPFSRDQLKPHFRFFNSKPLYKIPHCLQLDSVSYL